MSDTPDAIRNLLDEQERAWEAGDAERFSRATMQDIVFTNVVGLFSVGRVAFEAQHRHIFSSFYKGSTMRQSVERITFIRSDVAVLNTFTEVTGFQDLPPIFATHDGKLQSRLEQVLTNDGDGWRVAAFHNVIVHPRASAAAPARR